MLSYHCVLQKHVILQKISLSSKIVIATEKVTLSDVIFATEAEPVFAVHQNMLHVVRVCRLVIPAQFWKCLEEFLAEHRLITGRSTSENTENEPQCPYEIHETRYMLDFDASTLNCLKNEPEDPRWRPVFTYSTQYECFKEKDVMYVTHQPVVSAGKNLIVIGMISLIAGVSYEPDTYEMRLYIKEEQMEMRTYVLPTEPGKKAEAINTLEHFNTGRKRRQETSTERICRDSRKIM